MSNTGAILITGANGGIGQYVAHYLLSQGYRNIVCHYRTEHDRVTELLKQFELSLEKHMAHADLTDEKSITDMVGKIQNNFGSIYGLLNIAGSSSNGMSWKLTKNEFMRVIEDNLLTGFLCNKAVIPIMREQKLGRIVHFSSIVGSTGIPGASHYCAAKAGIMGLTKSLAQELASKNITVNALALGYFSTGLIDSVPPEIQTEIIKKIPMNRLGNEEDVGSTIKFLLSPEASFLTGQVLHLNGGQF